MSHGQSLSVIAILFALNATPVSANAPFRLSFNSTSSGFGLESSPRIGLYSNSDGVSSLDNPFGDSYYSYLSTNSGSGSISQFGNRITGSSGDYSLIGFSPTHYQLYQSMGSGVFTDVKKGAVAPAGTSSGSVSTNINTVDQIKFQSIDGSVSTGTARFTFAFEVDFTVNSTITRLSSVNSVGSYSFGSQLLLYEDANHAFGQFGKVKLNESFIGGAQITSNLVRTCPFGPVCLNKGFYSSVIEFNVDSDDTLYINTRLFSQLRTSATAFFLPGGQTDLDSNFASSKFVNNFSNSGFILFEMVSPGLSYQSSSGTRYLTAIPQGAVPEPQSWAMFIVGFGLAGAAMRRRRMRLAAA